MNFPRLCILVVVAFLSSVNGQWQNYVDDQLLGGGLTRAAIAGRDGSIKAKSSDFAVKEDEIRKILDGFSHPGSLFGSGFYLSDVKYMTIKSDEHSLYGKKGETGAVCVLTQETVLIGVYDGTIQSGNAVLVVERLGDFLKENGY